MTHRPSTLSRGVGLLLGAALTGAALSGGISIGPAAAQTAEAVSDRPVARTAEGTLRGTTTEGVDSFRGIPYAAPPVGALRWQPPQPVQGWSGVREAVSHGNRCPAQASTNGERTEDEDCLYLNVQRPANAGPGAHLPVMVWIHGGGLYNGSSNQHDGSLIVRETGAVVVTVNYRLGVLGLLAHPALTREAGGESGNYALKDQQAALRWVQRTIAAFGGDPRRVTVAGESAGAHSVCAHLVVPGSRNLFSQAIMQSGMCSTPPPLEWAEASGTEIAEAVGCTDGATAAACLRAVPAGTLLDTPSDDLFLVSGVPTMPKTLQVAVDDGEFARVPLLIGATRDEARTAARWMGLFGYTRDQYEEYVRREAGPRAEAVLAHYPWPAESDTFTAAYLVGAINTDAGAIFGLGGCTNLALTDALAAGTETYAYEFDHRDGPGLEPDLAGYVWGAGHAAELAYLWPSFDNGTPIAPRFDAGERRLSLEMVRAWGAFIRDGTPRQIGATPWPSFSETGTTMALRAGGASAPLTRAELSAEHQCELWSELS